MRVIEWGEFRLVLFEDSSSLRILGAGILERREGDTWVSSGRWREASQDLVERVRQGKIHNFVIGGGC